MQSTGLPPPPAVPDRDLETARQHARDGRIAEAEHSFHRVLQARPDSVEALQFLGNAAHARGDEGNAVLLLSRAAKAAPANVDVLVQLGIAYRAAERFDAARYVLERAVSLAAGRNAFARLTLANVLEADQRPELALPHYFLALDEARQARRWTTNESNVQGLSALVGHAERYVARGRRAWFEQALQRLEHATADDHPDRIRKALAIYLGEQALVLTDPRQRPGFMYVPGINTTCFLGYADLSWLDGAATAIAPCASEVDACIAAAAASSQSATVNARQVSVFQRGVLQYEARRHAPHLQRFLATLPLAHIPHHAPDVEIIALAAGARLPQQHGRSNSRCRAIVNLADSAALEVLVGGEKRIMDAGQSAVFDPSFGVEYLNAGGKSARALIVEVWHPDLSGPERLALSTLIAAAVDFDTRLQELK